MKREHKKVDHFNHNYLAYRHMIKYLIIFKKMEKESNTKKISVSVIKQEVNTRLVSFLELC